MAYGTHDTRGTQSDTPMTPFFSFHSAILIVLLSYPTVGYDDAIKSYFSNKRALVTQQSPEVHTVAAKDERRTDPSRDSTQASEYRPAREIKRFTEPTIFLRGTAEEIGLDSRTLTSFLEKQFLRDFAFLQSDFAFEKTYETWEIGLFECEAWTVGGSYPIAFHIQCTGGSMDEPRHWRFATLGYGPKEKIVDMVRKTLDSIVAEYATFVRKAHGRIES